MRNLAIIQTLALAAEAFWADGPKYNYDLVDTSSTCPKFKCDTIHAGSIDMSEQVFCYKQDVANPFEVKVKTCGDNKLCNVELNRCAVDPY